MCGIIGYIGQQPASAVLMEGLKHLEYRGYDSAGIAVEQSGKIQVRKDIGMVSAVVGRQHFDGLQGNSGIGHTRWATHGSVTQANAHPHTDCTGRVALAHNGVIENYQELRERLEAAGHRFASQTDTEVVAHLIEEYGKAGKTLPPAEAFRRAIADLKGSYAIAAIITGNPGVLVARRNSPLLVGIGKNEMLCASDFPAMLAHTRTFVPLGDGDWGEIRADGHYLKDLQGNDVERPSMRIDWNTEMAQKGGYAHFMLKEIHEQEEFIRESLAAGVGKARDILDQYRKRKVHIVACGTSYHAGLVLRHLLRRISGCEAECFIASEYKDSALPDPETLMIAISQSGETADTLQAVRWGHENGARLVALTNTMGSTLSRLADTNGATVYLNAGPEVSVAATKSFTSQLAVLYQLAYPGETGPIPEIVARQLAPASQEKIREIARTLKDARSMFFLGRGLSVPIAMEGALKMKEVTYIHAEAYPGGELKHGPLSLIEEGVPVVVLAPADATSFKMLGSIREVKARGAKVIAITNDPKIEKEADRTIPLPPMDEFLYPFAMTIPLQLLAYYTSIERSLNPDRPRNLAKAITVE